MTTSSTESLATRWKAFKEENPKIRIRNAAVTLHTTELELVATGCGEGNIRLRPEFDQILGKLETLGSVMALTRSDYAVHEAHGIYQAMKIHGTTALFFNPGIDARFFLDKWLSVYAVNENDRHSIQFFDKKGDAIHKIYLTENSNKQAYFDLVEAFTEDNQEAHEVLPEYQEEDRKTLEINPESLRESWLKIRDVHQGNRLIKQYAENQRDAIYQALGEEYAKPLSVESIELILETASKDALELMIFAMNSAAVQAYSGPVKKLMRTGPWFNVLDPAFNLHLWNEGIAKVWLIRKPSDDGWVTTIDVLDKNGIEFLLIADNRKRGETESEQWQALCNQLSKI